MKTKSIKQSVILNAKPEEVFSLIMDKKKHAKLIGSDVKMSTKIGGEFVVYDGYCKGHNIDIEPGKKIVQAWNFAEEGWPENHYSICTFKFDKAPTGTKLTFTQTGIPTHKANALKDGWKQFYWEPMKTFLKK